MGDLFQGLPPPSAASDTPSPAPAPPPSPAPPVAPAPALKSALKRGKSAESHHSDVVEAPVGQKRIRFKTTVDASEGQVIEAMQKIASHIRNRSKFGKAAKLSVQLIQAGSVRQGTSDYFFAILDAAMASPSTCTDPSVRADYQALFVAAQEVIDCLNKRQKDQLTTWTLRAIVANDLYTDDSFVFAKATGKIKEHISSLPVATKEDDQDEAAVLAEAESGMVALDNCSREEIKITATPQPVSKGESDPFGLDALLSTKSKKDAKAKDKKEEAILGNRKTAVEETRRHLRSLREALIFCLDIAAKRYKIPWTQTAIDILVKHAFDNIERFTYQQRNAIKKLWASIHEQQARRKQGKSVTGKLDMNAFEWLQEKYANEKISIRHAVGGSGARKAEQWLG